ncbi:hypothetical protein A9Q98_15570 [Thalassotalea sp. 42_200_T64]|nr:hypothetical protein A9Q98_15570 [Thalassotalea sp. 42_200_T64]
MTTRIFNRPIIILSAPRSGSTLLFETLSKVKGIWTIGDESHAVIEHIPKFSTVFRGFESNALTADDADDENAERLRQRFKSMLINRDGVAYDQDSEQEVRFLEKTPKNSLRIPFLNKLFPDALFIYLVRDPKANISSIIDAWQSGHFRTYPNLPGFAGKWSLFLPPNWQQLRGKKLEQIATHQWQVSNATIIKDLTSLAANRWKMINYQQLIDQPEQVVKDICQFAGLDADEQLTDSYKNGLPLSQYTLTTPDKNKWHKKAHLLAPQMSQVGDLVASLNEHLGNCQQEQLTTDIAQQLIDSAKPVSKALTPSSSVQPPVSRNSPCPCGSNKRYKQCHGQLA